MRTRFVSASALALALVFGLGACASGGDSAGSPGSMLTPPATASPSAGSTVTPDPQMTPSSTQTTTPSASPPLTAAPPSPSHVGLAPGDKGAQVLALQKRLTQLGFWISGADGSYGETTQQAVLAVQKAGGLERDGVAGPLTMKAITTGVTVQPRSTTGRWLEIDKTRQLLMIVTNGKVDAVLNTSTGSGLAYQQGGQTYLATTPSGQFAIFRQVDADDPGPLGDLWRPKYFNGGIAVHGAASIPGYPASHGCARLSNAAIDWIWSSNQAPIGTKVWVY